MPRKRAIIKGFKSGWHTHVSPAVQSQDYSRGALLLDDSWADVKNVQISPFGTIEKRSGAMPKMTTSPRGSNGPAMPITRIYQYWTADSTSYLLLFAPKVAGSSAGIWEWTAVDSLIARGGLGVSGWSGDIDDKVWCETFADCLIVTNGEDQPAFWDAAAGSSEFASMPSTCYPAKCLKAFKNYLFLGYTVEAAVDEPGRIRWSKPGVFKLASDWPAANYLDLDPDDGDRITGMELLGDQLIVFKEKTIYAVSYIGGPWVFDYETKVDGKGCVAGLSITSGYDNLTFLAEDGFYTFNGSKVDELSTKIKDRVLEIDPDQRHHVVCAPLDEKDQLWFTIPYAGDDTISTRSPAASQPCNEVWVYDDVIKYWTRFDLSLCTIGSWYQETDLTIGDLVDPFYSYDWDWNARLGLSGTPLLLGGDFLGMIHDMNLGSRDAGGTKQPSTDIDIDAWAKTFHFDFGDPTKTKRLYRTIFMITPMGSGSNYDIDVTFNADWGANASAGEKTISVRGNSSIPMVEKRIDWTQCFRSLQLKFGTNSYGEPYKVQEIIFEYETIGKTGDPTYG